MCVSAHSRVTFVLLLSMECARCPNEKYLMGLYCIFSICSYVFQFPNVTALIQKKKKEHKKEEEKKNTAHPGEKEKLNFGPFPFSASFSTGSWAVVRLEL